MLFFSNTTSLRQVRRNWTHVIFPTAQTSIVSSPFKLFYLLCSRSTAFVRSFSIELYLNDEWMLLVPITVITNVSCSPSTLYKHVHFCHYEQKANHLSLFYFLFGWLVVSTIALCLLRVFGSEHNKKHFKSALGLLFVCCFLLYIHIEMRKYMFVLLDLY